jgi:hypothetical protein
MNWCASLALGWLTWRAEENGISTTVVLGGEETVMECDHCYLSNAGVRA